MIVASFPESNKDLTNHTRRWSILFGLAGSYNLVWGAAVVLFPNLLFDLCGAPRLNYPAIMQCLGMVIGLYGLGYWYIARHPREGAMLATLGLLGKIGGPLGWVAVVYSGQLPASSFPLIVFDDLIWLPGFVAYLKWVRGAVGPAPHDPVNSPPVASDERLT